MGCTVASLCKQFTKKLEKIQVREMEESTAAANQADKLRQQAVLEDNKAKRHKKEAVSASKAIDNIKAMFGQ